MVLLDMKTSPQITHDDAVELVRMKNDVIVTKISASNKIYDYANIESPTIAERALNKHIHLIDRVLADGRHGKCSLLQYTAHLLAERRLILTFHY